MRWRELLSAIAGAAAIPLVARGQTLPLIGFFINGTADGYVAQVNAFRQGTSI
jgi:hypothetical protein